MKNLYLEDGVTSASERIRHAVWVQVSRSVRWKVQDSVRWPVTKTSRDGVANPVCHELVTKKYNES